MKIGWIGLGQMGQPMALEVARAGFGVTALRRHEQAYPKLEAAAVSFLDDVKLVASQADLLMLTLFNDAQMEEVLFADGVADAMKPGAIIAVHTTGSPSILVDMASRAPHIGFVDATFSGGPADAENHQIKLFLGGEPDHVAKVKSVCSAYCSPVFDMGTVGVPRRFKLINNFLFAAHCSLAVEALEALNEMGIDQTLAMQALNASSGASYGLQIMGNRPIAQSVEILTRYLNKDSDAARAVAKDEGITLELISAAADRWRE